MRKILFSAIFFSIAVLFACGGGGGGGSTSGDVALFVTDDISDYKQVVMKIKDVSLERPGGSSCDLLSNSVSLNLANLSSLIQLLDVNDCTVDPFGTLHLEFDKTVMLVDDDNDRAECDLTKYKDSLGNAHDLDCDGNTCEIDFSYPITPFAGTPNELVLDFELDEFETKDFPSSECTVRMRVHPLSVAELDLKKRNGYKQSINGQIRDLNTGTKKFSIVKGESFRVDYEDVSQRNIDQLMELALAESLPVYVEASDLDLRDEEYSASSLFTKLSGTVSNLNRTEATFLLTTASGKTYIINYHNAQSNDRVEGRLDEGAFVTVKLNTIDGSQYSAWQVEVTNIFTET